MRKENCRWWYEGDTRDTPYCELEKNTCDDCDDYQDYDDFVNQELFDKEMEKK